ncbi:hypothetical protein AHAS_Ahas19G0164200 [Arachis hypogaea]
MILTKPNWFISAPICYLNKEQDGDLALQMKINACYSWIFQCLPQLKKLFLLKKKETARMYGDCQVMSTMGGNVVVNSSETLFSSLIQNNSFTFMPTMHFHHSFPTMKEEDGILRGKEEIMESGSGSEQVEQLCYRHASKAWPYLAIATL